MTQPFVISMKAMLDPSDLKSGAQASQAAIREISQSATKAEAAVKASIFNSTNSFGTRGAREAARDIDAYGKELDSLRARYNPLFAASKQYEAELREINRAHSIGAISAQEQAAAVARLDAQYTTATAAMNMNTAAARANHGAVRQLNSAHTTNLLFQGQDIAMMALMGQAPGMLAMQQGMQVGGIFHQIGNGKQIVQALGGALVGLLNPLNLATIAFIGFGAAGVQALMGMVNSTEDANRSLEDHADWLDRLLEGYDDLQEKVGAYIEEASRLPASLAQLDITEQLNEDLRQLEFAQNRIANFRIRDDAFISFGSINEDLAVLRQIKQEFDGGAISAEQFAQKLRLIEMNPNVDNEVRQIAGSLYETSQDAVELETKVESARQALEGLADVAAHLDGTRVDINVVINGTFDLLEAANDDWLQSSLDDRVEDYEDAVDQISRLTPDLRSAREKVEAELAAGLEAALTPEAATKLQADAEAALAAIAAQDAQRAAKRSASKRSELERETQAIRDRIDALKIEAMTIGLSEAAALRFTTAMGLVRAAEKDGVAVTGELLEEINALSQEYVEAEAAAGRFGDKMFDIADGLKSAFSGIGSGILSALREGGDVAGNVLDMLIDKAWQFASAWIDNVVNNGLNALTSILFPGTPSAPGSVPAAVPNANGNVFAGDTLDAHRNQIVSRPTYFAFAKGAALGVMGEAGEEAIMPLARNSSGQLGVHVANQNQANDNWRPEFKLEQNITPPSGYEMRSREEDTPGGKRQDIWFEEAVAGAIKSPRGQKAVRNTGRTIKR